MYTKLWPVHGKEKVRKHVKSKAHDFQRRMSVDDDEQIAVSALEDMRNDSIVYRVSNLPIVNQAIRAYSHSKANSSVVKVYFQFYYFFIIKSFTFSIVWR
jgi:hypothetical protein